MARNSKQAASVDWHPQSDDAGVATLDAPSGADVLADLEALERSAPPSGAMVANEAERRAAQAAKTVAPLRKPQIGRGRMTGGKNVPITPMGEAADVPAPTFDRASRRDFLVQVVQRGADVNAALAASADEYAKLADARNNHALSMADLDRMRVLEVERLNLQTAQRRIAAYYVELLSLVPHGFTTKIAAITQAITALSGISGLDREHQAQVDDLRQDLEVGRDTLNSLAKNGTWAQLERAAK